MLKLLAMLLSIAVVFAVAYTLANWFNDRPLAKYKLAHWAQALPDLHDSAVGFYHAVSTAIDRQQMPGVKTRLVSWRDGGVHAEKRDYLRIEREDLAFDLYVAPFGTSLFVAYWFCRNPTTFLDLLARVPILGWLAWLWVKLFRWETYYRVDSRAMFQSAVHNCILQVIAELTTAEGTRPVLELERRPVLPELAIAR